MDEESLLVIRDYAKSLGEDERKSFIDNFNSIKSDDKKIGVLAERIKGISSEKPSPKFATVEEARRGMQEAQAEQRRAEFGAKGINPYVNAMFTSAEQVSPLVVGGGLGMGLSKLAGAGVLRQAAAGLGAGGAAGLVTPADSLQQRGINTGIGATGGAVTGAALPLAGKALNAFGETLRKIPARLSDSKSVKFAEKIRGAFINTKTKAVEKFGKGLEDLAKNNPDKKINLFDNDTIQNIATDPDLPVEARSVFNKTPVLRDILKGTRSAEVSVKEAQEIANYLQNKIPVNIRSQHLDIAEMVNEVKAAQADAFPEQMKSLRTEYAKVAQPYKTVASKMKLNNVLSSIDDNFKGSVERKALKDLFADNKELLREMGGYKNAGILLKGIKWSAAGLVGKKLLDTSTGR